VLTEIKEELDRHNQATRTHLLRPMAGSTPIVHRSTGVLKRDLRICVKHEVPVWITSLGGRASKVTRLRIHAVASSCTTSSNNKFAKKLLKKVPTVGGGSLPCGWPRGPAIAVALVPRNP